MVLALTSIVALNRAVAEVDGPQDALEAVDASPRTDYYLWHAVRADLLQRLGRPDEARQEYDSAIALTANAAERAHLDGRRGNLE
jgi:RNA polymerase sigma-70 factor (ECF subfamily)